MKIDVLVSTMNQSAEDFSLLYKMNLSGNVLVCNQTNKNYYLEMEKENLESKMWSFKERGIGRSRNTLLLRSNAEVCVLADDDMVFLDNYKDIVEKNFKKRSDADVIIFNIDDKGTRFITEDDLKVNKMNFTKFGAARIAFRRKSIIENNINFNMLFGGGAVYGSGEDTLFLRDCVYRGLKVIAVSDHIARLEDDRESTWFTGFNSKYFFDKGALYYAINPKLFYLNILQYSLRKYKLSRGKLGFLEVLKLMYRGGKSYKVKKAYDYD